MSQVLSLLNEMRGRLGIYLGVSSIIRLASFLRGYKLAVEKFSGTRDSFLPTFRDWIHQRFQSNQHSWEETVLLHSVDEVDAVKRFWDLFDEFIAERHDDFARAAEYVLQKNAALHRRLANAEDDRINEAE